MMLLMWKYNLVTYNLLENIFKGRLQSSFSPKNGEIFLLHSVWPDEFRERIRFNNVNRLLRKDTLSMGSDSIRSVGDQVPPFAVYDQDGEIITTDYLDGSVTILNFIFTRCSEPDMCPAATLKMKKLQELVEKTKIPYVKFLSITLDPYLIHRVSLNHMLEDTIWRSQIFVLVLQGKV